MFEIAIAIAAMILLAISVWFCRVLDAARLATETEPQPESRPAPQPEWAKRPFLLKGKRLNVTIVRRDGVSRDFYGFIPMEVRAFKSGKVLIRGLEPIHEIVLPPMVGDWMEEDFQVRGFCVDQIVTIQVGEEISNLEEAARLYCHMMAGE
jgi:hypothetical protein